MAAWLSSAEGVVASIMSPTLDSPTSDYALMDKVGIWVATTEWAFWSRKVQVDMTMHRYDNAQVIDKVGTDNGKIGMKTNYTKLMHAMVMTIMTCQAMRYETDYDNHLRDICLSISFGSPTTYSTRSLFHTRCSYASMRPLGPSD